jgi:ribonucleoside-diphosphate reductase alpha chain
MARPILSRTDTMLDTPIARHIWRTRYRAAPAEKSVAATWRRLAHRLAAVEPADNAGWEQRFLDIMRDFQFLPGGRIQAGAGTARDVTLFNCFVMGTIEDSIPGIFRALREGAITMQSGGGIGCDFSTIRPRGARADTTGAIASGPVSFMDVWDAMCVTIESTGSRRGAMMATLRCDHPDIEDFIDSKRRQGRLRHFNLSVQVTDTFMQAVEQRATWKLVFPATTLMGGGDTVMREWPGQPGPVACRVVRQVPAHALWERMLRASYCPESFKMTGSSLSRCHLGQLLFGTRDPSKSMTRGNRLCGKIFGCGAGFDPVTFRL